MEQITFECETITPMFLAGADGKTAELRPPSIKGAMRFWWRAMNGHLSIEELKASEAEIFGGSGEKQGRSKVVIKYPKIIKEDIYQISLMPHHNGSYCNKNNPNCFYGKKGDSKYCYKSKKQKGKLYTFLFDVIYSSSFIKFPEITSLIKLVFALGGLGKRSRRGFGSVKITRIKKGNDNFKNFNFDYSLEAIKNLLNSCFEEDIFDVNHNSTIGQDIVKRVKPAHRNSHYPYIKEIYIGQTNYANEDALLRKVGEQSSKNDCYYTGFAGEKVVGSAERFASPIYVSAFKVNHNDFRTIVTRLNCSYKQNISSLKYSFPYKLSPAKFKEFSSKLTGNTKIEFEKMYNYSKKESKYLLVKHPDYRILNQVFKETEYDKTVDRSSDFIKGVL